MSPSTPQSSSVAIAAKPLSDIFTVALEAETKLIYAPGKTLFWVKKVKVEKGLTKKSVVVTDPVNPVNCMEILYMTVIVQ